MKHDPYRDLITEIERYCEARGIRETTFGQQALKDRRFVKRLREGGRCWPETIDKVHAFINANPPEPSGETGAAA